MKIKKIWSLYWELRPQERKDKGIHVKKTYLQPNTGVLLTVHTSVIGQNIPPAVPGRYGHSLWLAWPISPLPTSIAVNYSVVKIRLNGVLWLAHQICLPKVRLAVSKAVNHFCHVEFTNSQNLHVFSKDCNSHLAEEFFSLCLCKMMSLTGEQGPEKLARCDRYSSLFQQKPLHAIVAADMEYSFQRPQRGWTAAFIQEMLSREVLWVKSASKYSLNGSSFLPFAVLLMSVHSSPLMSFAETRWMSLTFYAGILF